MALVSFWHARVRRLVKGVSSQARCCVLSFPLGWYHIQSQFDDLEQSKWLSLTWAQEQYERLQGSGTIELLHDLNEGTLSVFENGRRRGVRMKKTGR